MAEGRGECFWPRSQRNTPKQSLTVTDDGKTTIQLAAERMASLVKMGGIYIATNKDYRKLVLEQFLDTPEENILCEPISRNTTPYIRLGVVRTAKEHKGALMLVLPSDYSIKLSKMFVSTLGGAYCIVEMGDNLVTIGIMPDYPEAGYEYIKLNNHKVEGRAYKVERFVEGPSLEAAKECLATEEYL